MLTMEQWARIRELRGQGLSTVAIARRLGCSRNTVLKHLDASGPPQYSPRPSGTKLASFQDYLGSRLAEFPELSTTLLFEEIRQRGYTGSYSVLLRYLRPLREPKESKAVVRFETPPGLQAQVDWVQFDRVEVDGQRRTLYAFVMTLGYSRARYVEFTLDVSTTTFIACHIHAFAYFSGFTQHILYDNLKSVVLRRALLAANSQFNPLYLDFAGHYGLVPRLATPYRAQTKGKVERTARVVRESIYAGPHFTSLQELNVHTIRRCDELNRRPNWTTRVPPFDRLAEEHLTPVEGRPVYPNFQRFHRHISRDCYVNFLQNRYTVPHPFAGREATVVLKGDGQISIEVAGQEVARHPLSAGAGNVIEKKEHLAGLLASVRRKNQALQMRLESFPSMPSAPAVEQRDLAVYDQLLEEKK